MAQRLQERIGAMISEREGEDCAHLHIVSAVVDDTVQVISSSIADWADIIGDELIALETIKELEKEKSDLRDELPPPGLPTALEERVSKIDARIATLAAALPTALRYDAQKDDKPPMNRAHSNRWMRRQHWEQRGLRVKVVAGGQYTCERDPASLGRGERLYLALDFEPGIAVSDEQSVPLGSALNDSPLPFQEFRATLQDCYETMVLPVEFLELERQKLTPDGTLSWYTVRVLASPSAHKRGTDAAERMPGGYAVKQATAVESGASIPH